MTEDRKKSLPTVFDIIIEEYTKAVRLVVRTKTKLKAVEAKRDKILDAMRELGYPLELTGDAGQED